MPTELCCVLFIACRTPVYSFFSTSFSHSVFTSQSIHLSIHLSSSSLPAQSVPPLTSSNVPFVCCADCLRSCALNQIHIDFSHVYEFIVLPTQTNQSETIYESARFARSSCTSLLRWHRRILARSDSGGNKNENIILLQCLRIWRSTARCHCTPWLLCSVYRFWMSFVVMFASHTSHKRMNLSFLLSVRFSVSAFL